MPSASQFLYVCGNETYVSVPTFFGAVDSEIYLEISLVVANVLNFVIAREHSDRGNPLE